MNERRIQLVSGDCEPHLLNVYQEPGFHTYTRKNVNSVETGYLVPLVLVAEDVDYLREIKSPVAKVVTDFGAAGDRVIKKGNVAQNMFVVVAGTLEVRADGEVKALLSAGDMFGDIAFFSGLPRTLDVHAAPDDTRIISLSETTLRSLMESQPQSAAKPLTADRAAAL